MVYSKTHIVSLKLAVWFAFLLLNATSYSQKDKVEKSWENQKDQVEYRKDRNFKGPKEWYSDAPADIEKDDMAGADIPQNSANSPAGNPSYSKEQIENERKRRYGQGYSGNKNKQPDPELVKPDPIEFPEFDPPDIDGPDIDLPDVDAPDFLASEGFWKTILFLILFSLLIWLVYLFIKHRQPKDKKIAVQSFDSDWNPETITKTELEILLEKATANEDYRECLRIYFTFILKEIGKKGWINWRKEKTNYHYVMEMKVQNQGFKFEEIVRVYDLVWYGDYHISEAIYNQLLPSFVTYYSSLNPTKDE